MRQIKKIFYIIYFSYIGLTVIFAFNQNFLVNQMGLARMQIIYTLWAVFGVLLMLSGWALGNVIIRKLRSKLQELEKTNTTLKAKLFDQEELMRTSISKQEKYNDPVGKKNKNQDIE